MKYLNFIAYIIIIIKNILLHILLKINYKKIIIIISIIASKIVLLYHPVCSWIILYIYINIDIYKYIFKWIVQNILCKKFNFI